MTAIITGASAGIGSEFARQLAKKGYSLILVARRGDRLRQASGELQSLGAPAVEIIEADLATDAGVATVVERIQSGPIDLLVNNAGFGIVGRFADQPIEPWEQMHRLHVMAAMRLTHAALQSMKKRDQGAIIQVSSVAAFFANDPSYGGTKAWMLFFTEGLDGQLKAADSKIRVQALCPGFTRTEFHDVAKMDKSKVSSWLWLPAERVVRESLDALNQDKVVYVPGWRYKILSKIAWLTPRAILRPYIRASNRKLGRG